MKKKPAKTKKQIEAEKHAKIPGIRAMRAEYRALTDIAAYYEVSSAFVSRVCKDIKIEIKRKKKNQEFFIRHPLPCITYSINELSEEEQKKYNDCMPPIKGEDKEAYIIGTKGAYYKANVFEASRRGYEKDLRAL